MYNRPMWGLEYTLLAPPPPLSTLKAPTTSAKDAISVKSQITLHFTMGGGSSRYEFTCICLRPIAKLCLPALFSRSKV